MKYSNKLGLSYILIIIFYITLGIIFLILKLGLIAITLLILFSVILIPIFTIIVNKIDVKKRVD